MIETLVSLLLTFAVLWQGRDQVWTPTFDGTREERFVKAVNHYSVKMGLEDPTIEILDGLLVIEGEPACFWARKHPSFRGDVVGMSRARRCRHYKPELYALHEQSHRRLAHLEPAMAHLTREQKEREVEDCMRWYSAEERR